MSVDGEFKVLLVIVFVGMYVPPQTVLRDRARVLRDREGKVCGSLALNAPE